MITKIENALLDRLKRGLGGLVYGVSSYTGQFDDPELDIRRLPVALVSYGGTKSSSVNVGMSSGKRFKNVDTFVVLVISRSFHSEQTGRHGSLIRVGANQLIEAVKYLLINQTLGQLVEPIKPLRVRTLWNNKEVKKEKLSAYAIEFEISYLQAPALEDGRYPEGSDDESNIEYLFKHYQAELDEPYPDLSAIAGKIYNPTNNAEVGFEVKLNESKSD
ncbi:DUF1834 family protein [Conservatibacter flavescens]|uniref:DUF1834 domain-containing protein n=1 Tax=Conservatibacter flavescens TaxID=28161 RepID=A0A2M8S502_9PAST|nr:DUF1834 family protein [Conservatibacter flavescens]PJG86214.1 hypothetical protein CVP05_03315 [Conservatibacter flavescens]